VAQPDSDHARHDVATLRVRREGGVDPPRVLDQLSAAFWLGDLVDPVAAGGEELAPGTRRYLTDLVMPLPPDGRLLSFRKAAFVDLGRPGTGASAGLVPVAWRSASLAPLFPVFAGHVQVSRDAIEIVGHYAPPGGSIGLAADRVLLHIAARGTARWFVDRLAEAAGAEAGRAV
jgi:hypothetical protein